MSSLAKLMRWTLVLGAIGAVAWAMRERFVSLSLPRDPQPPAFRSPDGPVGDDLTVINGVGPVYADRLQAAGFHTVRAVAGAEPSRIAAATGVAESRATRWVEDARSRS